MSLKTSQPFQIFDLEIGKIYSIDSSECFGLLDNTIHVLDMLLDGRFSKSWIKTPKFILVIEFMEVFHIHEEEEDYSEYFKVYSIKNVKLPWEIVKLPKCLNLETGEIIVIVPEKDMKFMELA